MKYYALTFPQLVAQAMVLNLDDNGLARLRAGYDLAERMADGLYRSQGCPFVNHLVRTSSIVLSHGGNINQAIAAMLHSAYMLDCFRYSRRRAFRAEDRGQLSMVIGPDAEEIVWEYYRLDWGSREIIAAHIENMASYNHVIRSVLFIRIANELEDYLDLAVQYRPGYSYRNRIAARGDFCVDLAGRLGVPDLGGELREAYEATLSHQIPGIAVRRYINAYELPRRHFHERNLFEYVTAKADKVLRKFLRSLRGA